MVCGKPTLDAVPRLRMKPDILTGLKPPGNAVERGLGNERDRLQDQDWDEPPCDGWHVVPLCGGCDGNYWTSAAERRARSSSYVTRLPPDR